MIHPGPQHMFLSLWKEAYLNILKILQPKRERFQMKNSDIFHISSQNIDCRYSLEPPWRGSSNDYPQSKFFSQIRKQMYTPVNLVLLFRSGGLRGSKLYRPVFMMWRIFFTSTKTYVVGLSLKFYCTKFGQILIYIFIDLAFLDTQ